MGRRNDLYLANGRKYLDAVSRHSCDKLPALLPQLRKTGSVAPDYPAATHCRDRITSKDSTRSVDGTGNQLRCDSLIRQWDSEVENMKRQGIDKVKAQGADNFARVLALSMVEADLHRAELSLSRRPQRKFAA